MSTENHSLKYFHVYLVFNEHGFVRARKSPSYLEKGERQLKLRVKMDLKIFQIPQFEQLIDFTTENPNTEIELIQQEIDHLKEKKS